MKPAQPIIIATELFLELDVELLAMLRDLADDEWNLPTVCSLWTVKDIAAHLLDGSLRRLSAQRDGYFPPEAPRSFDSYVGLLSYLNELNASWTKAARRISPRMLVDLLAIASQPYAELLGGLDPFGPALFSVAWAGEHETLNWMDVARDYSEKWHHQQQIALATGRPGPLASGRLTYPALDTFMRALPRGFGQVDAVQGTLVEVRVNGPGGGSWFLVRRDGGWQLGFDASAQANAMVTLDTDSAWRILTKRLDASTALARFPTITIEGESSLGRAVLETVSIMA